VRALAVLVLLAFAPATLVAQGDTTFTGWLRFPGTGLPDLRTPPGLGWPSVARLPEGGAGAEWNRGVGTVVDSLRADRARAYRLRQIYGGRLPGEEDSLPAERTIFGVSRNTVDLQIDGQARTEIRTERLKNLRCTAAQFLDLNSGCRAGFKAPRLDTYLSMRAGGLIGRRLHVDVDYDTERDFTARNNLQVYYEGLEDEIVRRVEVGTVTFRPPPSRFITSNIPANNFGVNATFEVGAVQFQAIAATQKGSQIAERTFAVGGTTVQPQDREARDLDYESSRFYWVVDPLLVPGFPAVDILELRNLTGLPPAGVVLNDVRVYRHRPPSRTGVNPNLGGINAVAIGSDTTQRVTALWELLTPNDYYVDGSKLWIALSARLDQNDYLAVSYQSGAGPVGTYPSANRPVPSGSPPADTLRLIVQPRVDATKGTFRHEMRQVYRVAGADLDQSSLVVNLTVNRSERPLRPGALGTYLAELGLATSQDPNAFNRQDRLFPRSRDPSATLILKESFIVFPTTEPFADPARLTPAERNDSLYRTPDYLLFSEGPPAKFVFRLRYNASSASDRSTLDLGALQIRDESETLYYNGRRLERGVDYAINYDLGRVTFLNPTGLFGNSSGTIQARFEERGVFAVAPTQIYGLATRYSLGETGGINLMGLYQVEQSAFNRPQLGLEASAHMVGGISTDLRFRPSAVTRFVNSLTSAPATAPSSLTLNAELALTKPDPNRSGQAYLEEFEGDPGIELSLRETVWSFGSRPQSTLGVDQIVGQAFDTADVVQMTWQNLVPGPNGPAEVRARDIDNRIQVAGQQDNLETVLYMSLQDDLSGGAHWTMPARPGAPRWRTMVTSLSSTGLDISKNEFLEFWVFHPADGGRVEDAGVSLVFDLGTVSEDAIAIAPESLTVNGSDSTFTGRQFVGLGRLDTERQQSGIFNAATDDIGILNDRPDNLVVNGLLQDHVALCRRRLSNTIDLFPWGDLNARCTNGNGVLDAEDLDNDNDLDASFTTESALRWVIDLRTSPYFVRNGVQSPNGSVWKLYRIPLRAAPDTIGSPNIRLVKHLRIGVVAENDGGAPDVRAFFALARMKFLGSPWVRRADGPIQGLAGNTSAAEGEMVATTISTENVELGYESPPGVRGGLDNKGGGQNDFGTQVNERSLRLIGRSVTEGQRVEAYYRFPSGPQNLLGYRQMKAWFRGRGPGWGANQDFQAYVRVGSDSRSFYQYLTDAQTTTWLPEVSIDLDRWRNLRAAVESRRLQGLPADSVARVACGGDTVSVAYVLCDGPYLVHIENPAINPPNLAQIQEVAAGILRRGSSSVTDSAELWVDDIRLVEPISNTGSALALDARLVASDVADFSAQYIRQDGYFQQLGGQPSYRTTGSYTMRSGIKLDRFLPVSLGLTMPFQASYARSTVDPTLLTGTDIEANDLDRLRRPSAWTFAYGLTITRVKRAKSLLLRGLVDPLSVSFSSSDARATSELSDASNTSRILSAQYNLVPGRLPVSLGLGGIVDHLPGFLRNTEGGKAARTAQLNLIPTAVRLSSGWSRIKSDLLTYQVPVFRAADSAVIPILSEQHQWRNTAGVSWQPLGMLSLSADLMSTRDLRRYSDSTGLGRLVNQSRRTFLGMDVGVERDRQLSTNLSLQPKISSWLRPRFLTGSGFVLSRSLTSRDPIRIDGDTAGGFILPQTLNNSRVVELGASVELPKLLAGAFGDSSLVARLTRRIRAVDVTDRLTRSSTFDLATFDPDLRYHLALGGLNQFLYHGADTAVGASELRTTGLNSTADLPLGITFTLGYSRNRASRYQRAGDGFLVTETKVLEWPRGAVRFTRTLTGLAPLSTVSFGTQFRTSDGVTLTPSSLGRPVESRIYSSSVSPDAQVSLQNGMVFAFSYNMLEQETRNSGSLSHTDQDDISASFNHSFTLPRMFGRVKRLVRSQVSTVFSKGTTCLQRADEPECDDVSDTRRKELRASFDSDLARIITGGLSFSYSLNEARHLDRKFQQIIITASLQLSLFAGDYR
jgi:hypothetical protein